MAKTIQITDDTKVVEFHIDSELLIYSVRDRPFLYDSRTQDFSNKQKKSAAWIEICEEVIPNWNLLTPEDKISCEAELQKKWRNMRDSYTKEYKKQLLESIDNSKKSRQYIYYQAMSFLEPMAAKRHSKFSVEIQAARKKFKSETTGGGNASGGECSENWGGTNEDGVDNEASMDDSGGDDVKNTTYNNESEDYTALQEVLFDNAVKSSGMKPSKKNLKKTLTGFYRNKSKPKLKECIQNLILSMDKQTNNEEKDSDEMFLYSLLPYFKRLNSNKKLQTQIEILTLLKQRLEDQEYE